MLKEVVLEGGTESSVVTTNPKTFLPEEVRIQRSTAPSEWRPLTETSLGGGVSTVERAYSLGWRGSCRKERGDGPLRTTSLPRQTLPDMALRGPAGWAPPRSSSLPLRENNRSSKVLLILQNSRLELPLSHLPKQLTSPLGIYLQSFPYGSRFR